MAIFLPTGPDPFGTGNIQRAKVGSEWDNVTDAQAAFARVEPILTVDQLKERFLFGIPLVAALPDPLTKKKAVYTDPMLKDAIMRACATTEMEVGSGFHIAPVEVTRRVPMDKAEYKSLGFFRVPDAPILRVTSLAVRPADGTIVYEAPLNWIDPGQFKKGQVNLIPLTAAFLGTGGVAAFADGGAAWLTMIASSQWVASFWQITYITGMDEGHIPLVVNELIGLIAAIDVLGKLAATYRIASYSTGLDSASQSVSGPGPALYDAAIQRMMDEKKTKLGRIKSMYFKRFVIDNV